MALGDAQGMFEQLGASAGIASDQTVQTYASNIIRAGLALTGLVLLCLIIYGGALWMTSGGVDKKVTQAKTIIGRAIIGFAIVMTSYAITTFVIESLTSI
ncbi:hypothetical protein A3H75_01970 [Candidatus Uhrbacteria bacterium RIFCSPLOWO2_02_FULL_51_9]|uniref:Conjugal transfer protein TrbC n=1 Tax=Candidatus Uhrbacteria bacterium RIFCSPLOWO2_02_FULL_51_9 TaxID=1802410 RepID=A0A1F7VEK6_9BACT|nr:MAG: hypothetical protein A3H75_01970 [Candidatus Uhrbacteria bacterium RIFCSPLOWO2_02_FULL_51_9]